MKMIIQHAGASIERKTITLALSILLVIGPGFGGPPPASPAAAGASTQGTPTLAQNQVWKFVINPRTGQITIRDSLNFHDDMALEVGAHPDGEGYIAGDVIRRSGRHEIVFRLDTIADPVLRQRWEGQYLSEYIKTKLCNLNAAKDFHGAEVRVGRDSCGFFDWRNGLRPEKPGEIQAAQSSPPPRTPGAVPPEPTEDFFPNRPQKRQAPPRSAPEDQISFANEPAVPAEEPKPAAAPAPGPVKPELEKQISDMLSDTDPARLRADINAGRWEFFRRQLFNPPEGPSETARAWKKVSSQPKFSEHSKMLAEMRWKMVVDLWAEVSRDHQVRIELIDSGKRNAYRSDIDLTIYSPAEGRGNLTMETLIKDFDLRFERLNGYKPANIDITIHNGDVFIPDVRSRGQSFQEYSTSLRKAVKQMRLKVTSGGDAYYVPGSNLETVQKRALNQGRVTVLDPKIDSTYQPGVDGLLTGRTRDLVPGIKKPNPEELPILRLDPNAGKWKVNSSRFEGVIPTYDRGNGFAIMSENLRQILLHGDDPYMASKYFNLAVNKGAGMGQVNTFMDVYALKPDAEIVGDMFLEAFDLEAGKPVEPMFYKSMSPNAYAHLLRCRWLIRTFGLNPSMPHQALLELYAVVNISMAIEHAKIKQTLNWDDGYTGRSVYLKRYFVEATENVRQAMPDFDSLPDGAQGDAIYGEAWRIHCKRLRNVITSAMVNHYRRALMDMTPQGIRRNSFRFMINPDDGSVSAYPDTLAATKLAEQRRVELAAGFEIINKIDSKLMREELIQEMIDKTPPELKPEVERLAKMTGAELDDFLSDSRPEDGPPGPTRRPISEVIAEKRQRVRQVSPEISEEEAGRRLQDPGNQTRLNEHIQRGAQLRSPADAPAIKRIFATIESWASKKATQVRSAIPDAMQQADAALMLPKGEYWKSIMNNLSSPLMLTSSTVNILRAYQTGDPLALRESILSEAIFFLPPAYGVAGIAIKDFSRGKYGQGLIALGTLGIIHYASKYWIPGAGQYLLAFSIVKGVPELAYYFVVNRMEEELSQQAFRSRPSLESSDGELGRRRAQKSPPFRQQTLRIETDPPLFPILYDNACMKAADDNTPMSDLTSMARRLWAPIILKDLSDFGLSPDSTNWESEKERLTHKYAFDTPYFQRMENIFKCFYPEVKSQLLPDDSNDEEVLRRVFGKVVSDWLKKQPEDYQSQFDSVFDLFGGSSRTTILERLASHLIGLYKQYEQIDVDATLQEAQMLRKMYEALEEQRRLEMQLLASKDVQLNRIEEGFQSLFSRVLNRRTPSRPCVELVAPTWYLDMSGFVTNAPDTGTGEASADGAISAQQGFEADPDSPGIPIAINVAADRADFPEPWSHDYELKSESVSRGAPEGFAPSEDEKKRLNEKDEMGRPKNEIYTVRLNAKGSVFDKNDKLIGETQSVPVVGYLIAPIPHVSGSAEVKITAMRPVSGGGRIPEAVVCKVNLDSRTERKSSKPEPGGEEITSAAFQDIRAGSHTITVTPLSPDWRDAVAAFDIRDPYSREAYASGSAAKPDKFPIEVNVSLTYKGKMPDTERSQNETASKTPARQTAGAAGRGAQAPGLSAECSDLLSWTQMMKDVNPGMAATYLAQFRQKCGTPPPEVEGPLRQQEQNSLAAATQAINSIEALMSNCEFERALSVANGIPAAVRSHPVAVAWITGNLATLQAAAAAQSQARALLRRAREAILARDANRARAFLSQALALPNLPACMQSQIAPLLEELNSLTQSKDKSGAPPAVTASRFGKVRVVVGIGSLVDSHKMTPYGGKDYMLLRSKASVVAQVIYNDGTQELKSGEAAFNDCLWLGYYRYMPALAGYVRTGVAYSKTSTGESQSSTAGINSRGPDSRSGPGSGSGSEAGDTAAGRPGGGGADNKKGDGNSLLGVGYVTREDMYNRVNDSTRQTIDEMERRADEVSRTCRAEAESRYKRCDNAAQVRDFEGNVDVDRSRARRKACQDQRTIETRACNDASSQKYQEREQFLERSYEEQVERPKQRRNQ